MILVTVGSQLPFDRLVKLIDDIAPTLWEPVFAQIGKGSYIPRNIESKATVKPSDFDDLISRATLIVSHAGIGTILTAQKHGKPILLFPRRVQFGEHRNDHQVATVNAMRSRPGIYVTDTEEVFQQWLRDPPVLVASNNSDHEARSRLKQALGDYLMAQVLARATKPRRKA